MRMPSIRALGVSLLLVACRDTDAPTAVSPPLVALPTPPARAMTDQSFFTAWSWSENGFRVSPIPTYSYWKVNRAALDERFNRQWYYYSQALSGAVLTAFENFAREHPGNLYLVGDEENAPNAGHGWDQTVANGPQLLADAYCAWLKPIWDADHSARFSIDFEQGVSRDYVRAVNAARANTPCASVPISSWMPEWTINLIWAPWDFGFTWIRDNINQWATWAVADTAKLTLGFWHVGEDLNQGDPAYVNRLLSAMELLASHPNVAHAQYYIHDHDTGDPIDYKHLLINASGALTPEGQLYANYQPTLSPNPFYLDVGPGPGYMQWQSNVHEGLRFGSVYWQENVYLGGVQYFHAIGMHAPYSGVGAAEFAIPVGATRFTSDFGFARQDNSFGGADANGRVKVDGNLVWSGHVYGSTYNGMVLNVSVAIPATAKRLRLEVDNGSDGTHVGDQTTWGNPAFTGPGVMITGPGAVTQQGNATWYANPTGPESYTTTWQVSYDNENSWTDVWTGSEYTRSFYNEGPYTMILRAKMVSSSGRIRTSKLYVSVDAHCPGGEIIC